MKFIYRSCLILINLYGIMLYSEPARQSLGFTDSNLPIQIKADHLKFDAASKILIYTGHVLVTQGGQEIIAEELTGYLKNNHTLEKIIIEGKPATYTGQYKNNTFVAHADNIEYQLAQKNLIFNDNVKISCGDNQLKAPRVIYNLEKESLETQGGEHDRAVLIFDPKDVNNLIKD